MKFMKLGSKPDSFQTDEDNIRYEIFLAFFNFNLLKNVFYFLGCDKKKFPLVVLIFCFSN